MWSVAKGLLRRKLSRLNAYIRKEERSQVSNITFHLKELKKKSKIKQEEWIK